MVQEHDATAARAARSKPWGKLDHSTVMGTEVFAGLEVIAGILTWAGIGWLLDRWLGTAPWLIAIGSLVGFAGGLYLLWMRTQRTEAERLAAQEQPGD